MKKNNANSETKRITLPYINKISEIASRLLKQHGIEVAHKPTQKLRTMFTKHKDTTNFLDRSNAIYMFPCNNCDYAYIGETSKKISTRLTEHKNAIRRHDPRSLPAKHTDDTGHKFNWDDAKLLGQSKTRHAREFKEAWYSIDYKTINRHIDIPTAYLQLKHTNQEQRGHINTTQTTRTTARHSTISFEKEATNQNTETAELTNEIQTTALQPIRRSERLRQQSITGQKQRGNHVQQHHTLTF